MKKHQISVRIIIASTILLFTGCGIFSLHPLYHTDDLIVKTELIGTWQNGDDGKTLIVIDTLDTDTYYFEIIDGKDTIEFKMGLLELNGQYFIDLFPHDNCSLFDGGDCYSLENMFRNYIPAHTFMKFDFVNDEIILTEFDNDRLINLFQQNRIRLAHEMPGDDEDYVVITASTDELQKFITHYANDDEAFTEPEKYHRL
jgi:hypothetical protein